MNTTGTVLLVGGVILAGYLYGQKKNTSTVRQEPGSPPPSRPSPASPVYSGRVLSRQQKAMADLIIDKAESFGINPAFMIALAVTESSLSASTVGDDGLSVGLFQLNKRFIQASDDELLDPDFNAEASMEKMNLLMRSFPGHTYGDYAEAWALGGAGRFKKGRRFPAKLTNMQQAINDLNLHLSLTERA